MSDPLPTGTALQLVGVPQLHGALGVLVLERKAAGALAWLVLHGPVLRGRLAELLWPQAGDEGGRNNLRQLIFRLKKQAGGSVIEGGEELRLTPALRLLEPPEGAELLAGCDFDDCPAFDQWLQAARQQHRDRDWALRLQAVDAAEQAGDLDRALAGARALVAADPVAEAAHQRLVRVLYLRGERRAALAAAQACEAVLHDQLGVAPSATTRALFASLQASAEAPPAAAPNSLPVSVLRPPRMVGRERDLAWLLAARAAGEQPWIEGEPGLGKSRLLAEALGTEPTALVVSARPGDAGVPFAMLARVLRAVLAQWPAARPSPWPRALAGLLPEVEDAGETSRVALLPATSDLLARAAAAGLATVALDDLHFADDASLEVVGAVSDANAPSWVFARRPAEGSTVLERLADQRAEAGRLARHRLQPLDEARLVDLLTSLTLPGLDPSAVAPTLLRATGGNPMFVLETLKAWLQQGQADGAWPRPRSVGALIERRLKQLSAPALALARVAALAGPDFSTELAVQVLATPLMALADAWAELEAAQVLRDAAFAHDLIYEATLASVPAAIQRHARRAIAEFLAPRGAEPARLAQHWRAAGEPARAAAAFRDAATRAEAAVRYAEAHALLALAADSWREAGDRAALLDTQLAMADLLYESGAAAEAQTLLVQLQQQAPTLDDRLRVAAHRAKNLTVQGAYADAEAMLLALLADDEVAEEATPSRVAELRHTLADTLLAAGRSGAALAQLDLARAERDRDDEPQLQGWFHSDYGRALVQQGDLSAGERHLETALACARRTGRRRMVAGVLQALAHTGHNAGRLTEPLERAEEALRLVLDAGNDAPLAFVLQAQCAREQLQLGRYREALQLLDVLAASQTPVPRNWHTNAEGLRVLAWSQLGRSARALAAWREGEARDPVPANLRSLLNARLEMAWLAGEPQAEWLQRLEAAAADNRMAQQRCQLLRWRMDPAAVDGGELAAQRERWLATGLRGHALLADVIGCHRAGAQGDRTAAALFGRRALEALRQATMPGLYRPGLWLGLWQGLRHAEPALAARAARDGADWVYSVARFHVDEALRDGFLLRNPVNQALLAAVQA